MDIRATDLDDFDNSVDERIDQWMTIGNNWPEAVDVNGRVVTRNVLDLDEAANTSHTNATQVTLLGIMQRQQEQINVLANNLREAQHTIDNICESLGNVSSNLNNIRRIR